MSILTRSSCLALPKTTCHMGKMAAKVRAKRMRKTKRGLSGE